MRSETKRSGALGKASFGSQMIEELFGEPAAVIIASTKEQNGAGRVGNQWLLRSEGLSSGHFRGELSEIRLLSSIRNPASLTTFRIGTAALALDQ